MAEQKHDPNRPSNTITVGTMQNAAIQQDSAGATQTVNIEGVGEKGQLADLIRQLLAAVQTLPLGADERNDLEAEAQTVQAQLKTTKPKPSILKDCLKTIKDILEKAVAAGAAPVVTDLLRRVAAFVTGG